MRHIALSFPPPATMIIWNWNHLGEKTSFSRQPVVFAWHLEFWRAVCTDELPDQTGQLAGRCPTSIIGCPF